jgi:hypothetical protein
MDFGLAVDLNSSIIPSGDDLRGGRLRLDQKLGRDIMMNRGLEDDKYIVLKDLCVLGGNFFNNGLALGLCLAR